MSHTDRFHTGPDGTTAVFFRNPIAFQYLLLSLGRSPAMASHRRDNIRTGPMGSDKIRQFPQYQRHIADLPAAARQHHFHARPNPAAKPAFPKLLLQNSCRVLNPVFFKYLTDHIHSGKLYAVQNLSKS